MSGDEKDINEVFDDIFFTEENLSKKSYEEGFQDGIKEGSFEGYELGFAKGVQLGEEFGSYYGTVIAHMQLENSEKTNKCLQTLKQLIEEFPRTNDEKEDILGKIEEIRNQYKKVKAVLKLSDTEDKQKNFSF